MRSRTPTIHCDADDGMCNAWDVDYYETCAHSVGGTLIRRDERAPGWTVTKWGEDLCPTCSDIHNHPTERGDDHA